MNKLLTLIIGIFLVSFVNATLTCDTLPDLSYETGTVIEQTLSFQCINPTNLSTVTLTKGGTGSSYFSFGSSGNTISSPGTKTFILDFQEDAPVGIYSGKINFDDGTNQLSFIFEVTSSAQIDPLSCHLNPTLVTYTQTVQQGTEFELPKITFNPKNCDGDFSIESTYISGGITTSEGQKPIYIKSSTSKEIILGVSTTGLSSAPYKSTLTLSAFDQTFTDVSIINIIVTGGTNPDTNFNVDNLPTCSITTNILNLNNTYSLVCTGITPGVSIYPIIDDEYIRGIGPGDDMTSTNFVWEFQPKKMGNTFIKAEFRYLDLPVGESFNQEVKIQSTSGQTPGTSLKLLFTPKKVLSGEDILIQLIDNKSESLVDSPEIYINAIKISSLNSSEKTFPYKFESDKIYEIRGKSPGYNDLSYELNVSNQVIELILIPSKTEYTVGDIVNITSNIAETKFLLDDVVITSPYTFGRAGGFILKGVKEGFVTKENNVTVRSSVSYKAMTPVYDKWKKGSNVVIELEEIVSWHVEFYEEYEEEGVKYYRDNVQVASGESDRVEFKIEDYGRYEVKNGDRIIVSKTIEKSGLFSWFNWNNFKENWVWWIVGFLVISGLFYMIFFREGKQEDQFSFTPPT